MILKPKYHQHADTVDMQIDRMEISLRDFYSRHSPNQGANHSINGKQATIQGEWHIFFGRLKSVNTAFLQLDSSKLGVLERLLFTRDKVTIHFWLKRPNVRVIAIDKQKNDRCLICPMSYECINGEVPTLKNHKLSNVR